jgi:hypothetical protein
MPNGSASGFGQERRSQTRQETIMTKLKIVATIALLLAVQPAFARGGGGGPSHGDHTTMSHNDHPATTHGQNIGRHAPNAHKAAEILRLEAQIRAIQAKLLKAFNMGMSTSAMFKKGNRQIAILAARLHRLGGQLTPAGAGA